MPSLPNVLSGMGYESWIPWIYGGLPIGAIISPFLLGALSDGKVPANRLCGYVMLLGGVTMTLSFWVLHAGYPVELFVGFMFLNSLFNAPIWSLITQSTLAHLSGEEGRFPYYRFWATVGWVVAGLFGGLVLGSDDSPLAGIVAGVMRFPAGLCCFLMPLCVLVKKQKRLTFLVMVGQGSKELWLNRNTRVLLISSGLIAIPISALFMYAPLQMKALGVESPTAWLTMAQWFELPAMLTLGWASVRFRIKWMIAFGLGVCVLRQALFAVSAHTDVFYPMALGFLTHGFTFTYFLTVAQMYMEKRVSSELRGRAQGMLSLMFGGVGNLIGVFLTAKMFKRLVDLENNTGWTQYWLALALLALIPTVYFLLRYQRFHNSVDDE